MVGSISEVGAGTILLFVFIFKSSEFTESGSGMVTTVLFVASDPLFFISIIYSALSVGSKLVGGVPFTVVAVIMPSGSGT